MNEIARENYQLAFQYLDELFFREMTPQMRKTWDQKNGLGPLLPFYSELIRKLPYSDTRLFKKVSLNYSEEFPLTSENRENLIWQIELVENQEVTQGNLREEPVLITI